MMRILSKVLIQDADDYITKPFNLKELCARVKAVIKRSSKELDVLKIKDIVYKSSNKNLYK